MKKARVLKYQQLEAIASILFILSSAISTGPSCVHLHFHAFEFRALATQLSYVRAMPTIIRIKARPTYISDIVFRFDSSEILSPISIYSNALG